jgi:hypothetical protein
VPDSSGVHLPALDFALQPKLHLAMPPPVVIDNQPFWARLLTVFWIAEAVLGLVFASVGVPWLGGSDAWAGAALVVGGVFLVAVGILMAAISWEVSRLRGPAIEMSAEGFRDRRLSEAIIPWDKMSWRLVFSGKSYSLQFDVAPEMRARIKLTWAHRWMSALNRLFGFPEYTVVTMGTGRSAGELDGMMRRFRNETLN